MPPPLEARHPKALTARSYRVVIVEPRLCMRPHANALPNHLPFEAIRKILLAMLGRILEDLRCLEPTNWEELASAAKFLTGFYGDAFRAEAMLIATPKRVSELEHLITSSLVHDHASLRDQAYAIHLGARAAAADARPGTFGTPAEFFRRVVEAGGSGCIIHGFVTAARTIVTANVLFKDDTGADVTHARDRASQAMFDGTLQRIEEHDTLLGPVRPRAATILHIVGSELGVLPASVRETIQGVLDFKGGPK